MVFQNDILAGSSGASGASSADLIAQSIRFNASDTAYMHRTPSSSGNRRTWTFSCWLKRGNITSTMQLFNAGANDSNNSRFQINSNDVLSYVHADSGSVTDQIKTNMVLRDTSAWYNIQLVADTTHAVKTERLRLYVNGQRITDLATTNYPTKDFDTDINNTEVHNIGRLHNNTQYLDGYLAEIVLIDGQALDPSSFGEYNSSNIWIPKSVSGLTFGANGFHITGSDASGTPVKLGDDETSNGNNFTTSGLQPHDQVLDSPTNNFCTINSVYADNAPAGNAGTLSNGNLQYVGTGSSFCVKGLTFNLPESGKWYFEYMIGGTNDGFGFVKQGEQGSISAGDGPGGLSVAQGGGIQHSGWRNSGNFTVSFGSTFTAGHIHQVAIDVDNGKFFYGIQNTYYASDGGTDGNPSAGTNETSTFAFSTSDVVLLAGNYSGTQYWNFGQDGTFSGQQTAQSNSDANGVGNFYYAPPTGYLALCTKNLGS